MISIGRQQVSLMILFAVALHLTWAPLLLYDKTVMGVVGIHAIRAILPYPFASIAMLFAALFSIAAFFVRDRTTSAIMLIPQQFLLLTAAGGAIVAIWNGMFPGSFAPMSYTHSYMLASQMPTLLAAIGHTIALLSIAQGNR